MFARKTRILLGGAALAAATLLVSGCGSTAGTSEDTGDATVVTVYGLADAFEEAITESIIDPFNESQDEIVVQYQGFPTSAEMLSSLRADKDNPAADVAIMDYSVTLTGNAEGVFEKVDSSALSNYDQLVPLAQNEEGYGPRFTLDNLSLIYNTETDQPPAAFADLAETRYSGLVGIDAPPDIRSLGLVAILAGGDVDNTESAFAEFATFAPNVETWKPNPEVNQWVIANPGAVGIGWNARAQLFADSSDGKLGVVKIPTEGTIVQSNAISVVAGGSSDAAATFIDYAISKEAQERFVEVIPYGPVNSTVELDPELKDKVATESGNIVDVDWLKVSQLRDEWTETWRREVQGG